MQTLCMLRHSLTKANIEKLYCGWTDLPLTEDGRALAMDFSVRRPLPCFDAYGSSGMLRAEETLELLLGNIPHEIIPQLKEMNFGAFEMHSYEQLLPDPEYIRWIEDETGDLACPGGESSNGFNQRVVECAESLIHRDVPGMLILCHGGVIANIMAHFFPDSGKNFYQWQPKACEGYIISFENGKPVGYIAV